MNLEDKNIRTALAEKYLSGETSVEEERALAIYYSSHQSDKDEKAFAAMVTATAGEYLLSDEGAKEFDRIAVPKASPLKMKIFRWAGGIAAVAAAAVALLLVLRTVVPEEKPLSPVVIAEGIGQLIDLNPERIESVNAVPQGSRAIVTVRMKNGEELYYIMTYSESSGSTSLVAINEQ